MFIIERQLLIIVVSAPNPAWSWTFVFVFVQSCYCRLITFSALGVMIMNLKHNFIKNQIRNNNTNNNAWGCPISYKGENNNWIGESAWAHFT